MSKRIRVYRNPPTGYGWEITDPARSLKQAKEFVRGGYQDADAIIVKTKSTMGNPEIFPYHIYTKRRTR